MTALMIALFASSLVGLGLAMLLWRLVPAQPDLGAALDNLAPEASLARPVEIPTASDTQDRLGLWVMRTLPVTSFWSPPTRELALLRRTPHRFYGEKALYFLIGLLFPAVASLLFYVFGVNPPIVVPLLASLVLGAALSFLPDYNVRSDAAEAREEFTRALTAYVDLVALERITGAGPRQAMTAAAEVGDSWVFKRIAEELSRSRFNGIPPWDSLTKLGEDLGLPDLSEVSDIMRLSGEDGAAVYQMLRARAASMRAATTNAELAKANAAGERMSLPVSALALIFLLILATPAILRVVISGG